MASRIRVNPNAFDREAIRELVHGFYTRRKYPTLDGVLKKTREQCGFPGGFHHVMCDTNIISTRCSHRVAINSDFIRIFGFLNTFVSSRGNLLLVGFLGPRLRRAFAHGGEA